MPSALPPPLEVAIIGGGPGGLGTAIALSSLPNVTVNLYEQARELREIGAGINIGYNCWKVLELLGAADGVKGDLKDQILHRFVKVSRCSLGFSIVGKWLRSLNMAFLSHLPVFGRCLVTSS